MMTLSANPFHRRLRKRCPILHTWNKDLAMRVWYVKKKYFVFTLKDIFCIYVIKIYFVFTGISYG